MSDTPPWNTPGFQSRIVLEELGIDPRRRWLKEQTPSYFSIKEYSPNRAVLVSDYDHASKDQIDRISGEYLAVDMVRAESDGTLHVVVEFNP